MNTPPTSGSQRRSAPSRFETQYLAEQEFDELHVLGTRDDLLVDAVLDVDDLAPDEQATAVMMAWRQASSLREP